MNESFVTQTPWLHVVNILHTNMNFAIASCYHYELNTTIDIDTPAVLEGI